jgi:hypothetical protein
MAKGKKGFTAGISGNPRGRKTGIPNRTTKEAKELLEQILLGQIDNIKTAFKKLQKDPGRYLDACSKLFTYVLPKKTDITTGDKPIQPILNVTVDSSETGEALKKLRDELSKTN